jgi:hypothetical protein
MQWLTKLELEERMTFETIYRRNLWNGIETRSGPGSGTAAATAISRAIVELADNLEVETVVDAACGEGRWQPALPGYLGLDVAPSAIRAAQRFHPERDYRVRDVRDGCPTADLVICRDAMQHLSLGEGRQLLEAIRASGSPLLLASTYVRGQNVDIATGEWYSPDLTAWPFNLPAPMHLIPDGYDYADPELIRDPAKHLALWWLLA